MQQHARQWAAFPALAVCSAFVRLGHQLRILETVFYPVVTPFAAIPFIPGIKVLGIPTFVPFSVAINQSHHFIHGCPPVRNLVEPLVDKAI